MRLNGKRSLRGIQETCLLAIAPKGNRNKPQKSKQLCLRWKTEREYFSRVSPRVDDGKKKKKKTKRCMDSNNWGVNLVSLEEHTLAQVKNSGSINANTTKTTKQTTTRKKHTSDQKKKKETRGGQDPSDHSNIFLCKLGMLLLLNLSYHNSEGKSVSVLWLFNTFGHYTSKLMNLKFKLNLFNDW